MTHSQSLYTRADAAALIGIALQTLDYHVKKKNLVPCERRGRSPLFDAASLQKLQESESRKRLTGARAQTTVKPITKKKTVPLSMGGTTLYVAESPHEAVQELRNSLPPGVAREIEREIDEWFALPADERKRLLEERGVE